MRRVGTGEPARQVPFTTTTTTTTVVTQTTTTPVVQPAGQPVTVVMVPSSIVPAPIPVATKQLPSGYREQPGSRSARSEMARASERRESDREARPAVAGRSVPVTGRQGEPARRY